MIVIPYIYSHVEGLELHDWYTEIKGKITEEYAKQLAEYPAYSVIVDGNVIACGGIIQLGKNRWQAWALMTEESGKHMVGITKEVKAFLDLFNGKRIETPVRHDFKAGHRWAKMLGFTNETPYGMVSYGDDGKTYDLYARIK